MASPGDSRVADNFIIFANVYRLDRVTGCRHFGLHHQLANGRRFRVLTVIDDVTKECLTAIPDASITGKRVVREMTALTARRGKPGVIVSDNGTESTSAAVLGFAQAAKVDWRYIAPGKPTQNAFAESFQGTCATSASTSICSSQ
jgi:transposase InsO family protein